MARFDRTRFAMDDDVLWFPSTPAGGGSSRNQIFGTTGDDHLRGTDGNDTFNIAQGGDDVLRGGAGDDKFKFGGTYTDSDSVFGGEGRDTVYIDGTSDDNLVLGPDNLRGVESLRLGSTQTYDITLLDGISDTKIAVRGGSIVNVDASDVNSARLRLLGGFGDDLLAGGDKSDLLVGGGGGDTLTGGEGNDRFEYRTTGDSTVNFGRDADLITDFAPGDRISLQIRGFTDLSFHIGRTASNAGDIVASYDNSLDRTLIEIFLDTDQKSDVQIYLLGNVTQLQVFNINEIVLF